MPHGRDRRNQQESEAASIDPIAMTLAIWLGVVVSITALGRLAQDAQLQAGLQAAPVQSLSQVGQSPQFVPLGG